MKDDFRETFKEEAYDLLAELESALLQLEKTPESRKAVGRVFRALHTIKGSGGMVGMDDIASFTHHVETVFELVRLGQLNVDKELVDLTLAAGDIIRNMLDSSENGDYSTQGQAEDIVRRFRRLVADSGGAAESSNTMESSNFTESSAVTQSSTIQPSLPFAPLSTAHPEGHTTYRIFFRPHSEIFSKGVNPLLLLRELRELGECEVTANLNAVPTLEEIDPEICYVSWDVLLTTSRDMNAIRDVFIFVEDDCELSIDRVDAPGSEHRREDSLLNEDAQPKKLGEILIERGELAPEELSRVLSRQKRIGELLVDTGLVGKEKVEAALAEQQHQRQIAMKRQQEETAASVRVPASKLDILVDLVGELVTVQASLSQLASSKRIPEMRSIAEHVDRLTAELRDNTMNIRMLPIGTTFNKFNRLVRDLSAELGKEAVLTTEGAETELDKTIIERLKDPLVHLIRNSIDHGIELPDVRTAAGKPRKGTVHLSAIHSGANVLIQIADDGAGLDEEVLRRKAMEKGLIAPNEALSQKDLFSLIFSPGFSTAERITNISGRGVGMDVVKRSIEALRGSIDISGQKGLGTTITLKLPLTLAIIDGLLVRIGKSFFVLPLSIVEECVELSRQDVAKAHGRHVAMLRGGIVPYIRLRERFSINGDVPPIEQIVVTSIEADRIGFVVDKVIGQHQTVIKSLGKMYGHMEGISGATILGDGTVALIIDIAPLVRSIEAVDNN